MLPAIVSQLVVLLKDTALGFLIVYDELLDQGKDLFDDFQFERPVIPVSIVDRPVLHRDVLAAVVARLPARAPPAPLPEDRRHPRRRGGVDEGISAPDRRFALSMSRVVVATAFGGPEVLSVVEQHVAGPGPGEVLIDVRAVGVNPIDHKQFSGLLARGPGAAADAPRLGGVRRRARRRRRHRRSARTDRDR